MLSSIFGEISEIKGSKLTINCGPIGIELSSPKASKLTVKERVNLFTHMHWNQDKGPSLFGFTNKLDKELFILIISISGVGPKMGITILDQIEASRFIQLITEENIKELSSLKSIGEKKAEQLIISLKQKVLKLLKNNPELKENKSLSAISDLTETLSSLNYSQPEIKQAISQLNLRDQKNLSLDMLLRQTLQILAK